MTEADLPLPLPLILGIFTLGGSLITAGITLWSKRLRTPADEREDRKIGLEADERLLKRFESMLEERDNQIKELRDDLSRLSSRVEEVVSENRALIDWIYVAVRIVRDLGGAAGIAQLPLPPKGVFIADHPSNFAMPKEAP